MSEPTMENTEPQEGLEVLRPHKFDGIQEFDNPMPNWWLAILGTSIAFALGYWAVMHAYGPGIEPGKRLTEEMALAAQEAAKRSGLLTDPLLWKMSQDQAVVNNGRAIYAVSCAPCHLPDLAGAIGPNLKDNLWVHGGNPMAILGIITEGVAAKGMPTWGPMLGRQKIAEVTAFILSYHKEGEPVLPAQPQAQAR
jgi:cytochrome c oxidase cbb3-type subunit 3